MSTPRKTILVTGATGKQGGALIKNLFALPDASNFNIIAVTRDITTPRALTLSSHFNVSVVSGDLSNPSALFQPDRPVWGVFSVQVNSDAEEEQGKSLIDAAIAHGVSHFVYSSADRGGSERSETDPTTVKNLAAKHCVEKHLKAKAGESKQGMTWTILRPTTFYEMLTNDVHGRGFARMWEQMGSKRLQFVSTEDIGWFAARSFVETERYAGRAGSLAGDELTQPEADGYFRAVVGSAMPMAPCPVASAVKFFLKGTVGDLFRWFEEAGYGADVEGCRREYPGMKDFKMWIGENKGRFAGK